ncbi:MAG TPA: reverse transcriptase-like protein [Gaiellales bacterium]|nr:reverse transcriptase-like protein [Gaiellales bacterium]
MTKGVRKAGKTMKDAERRRLARRSRGAEAAERSGPAPPGWAVVWCDGGSRGNPGPAAYAYVIDDSDGREVGAVAAEIGVATVGTAEYLAVAEGLAAAARFGLERVEVRTDSRLVVRHLVAERPLRNPALAALRDRARAAADELGGVRYRWVPAAANARADALVSRLLVSPVPSGE